MKQESLAFDVTFGDCVVMATVIPQKEYFELIISGIGRKSGKSPEPRIEIHRTASSCMELGQLLRNNAQKFAHSIAGGIDMRFSDGMGKLFVEWAGTIRKGAPTYQEAAKQPRLPADTAPFTPIDGHKASAFSGH